jgi:hypothetical protein
MGVPTAVGVLDTQRRLSTWSRMQPSRCAARSALPGVFSWLITTASYTNLARWLWGRATGEGGLEPALGQHQTVVLFSLTVCPCDEAACVLPSMVIAIAANEHPIAVCHGKGATT